MWIIINLAFRLASVGFDSWSDPQNIATLTLGRANTATNASPEQKHGFVAQLHESSQRTYKELQWYNLVIIGRYDNNPETLFSYMAPGSRDLNYHR